MRINGKLIKSLYALRQVRNTELSAEGCERSVWPEPSQVCELLTERDILAEGRQTAEKECIVAVVFQVFREVLGAAHGNSPFPVIIGDFFEVLEFCQDCGGGFFPPAKNTGVAVGGVTDQREPVGHR